MRIQLTLLAVAILGVSAFAEYERLKATNIGTWGLGQSQNFVTAQDSTVYDNITTFSGFAAANGGSTGTTTVTSKVLADDITCVAGGGQSMSTVTWYVANLNATAFSVRMRIRFWADDGVGNAPGTLLGGVSFNPVSLTGGSISGFFFNFYASAIFINIPVNKKLWYGMLFDNSGGTAGMTTAQMDNMGLGIFDPPTVGSSADKDWLASAAGSNFVSNPAGAIRNSPFGGLPNANYGLQIMVPEPGAYAAVATGLLGFLGLRRRK